MYIHRIGVIISSKVRYGRYAKGVAFRLLSTPHGMPLDLPEGTKKWEEKFKELLKNINK